MLSIEMYKGRKLFDESNITKRGNGNDDNQVLERKREREREGKRVEMIIEFGLRIVLISIMIRVFLK